MWYLDGQIKYNDLCLKILNIEEAIIKEVNMK